MNTQDKVTYEIRPPFRDESLWRTSVTVIESPRRTKSLEVKLVGEKVIILARMPKSAIRRWGQERAQSFVLQHEEWILQKARSLWKRRSEMMRQYAKEQEKEQSLQDGNDPTGTEPLSVEELKSLRKEAAKDLKARLDHFAPLVGVTYSSMVVRQQKTRWGSCSSKGTISLNLLLMLMPESVRDYVVVHELCHRKEMNHSARFWREVEKVLPGYKKEKAYLKKYGNIVMARAES